MVRWGIGLQGNKISLSAWAHLLKPGFEPWIEAQGEELVLHSKVLDQPSDVQSAKGLGRSLVDQLNGAVALMGDYEPLIFNRLIEYRSDGTRNTRMLAELPVLRLEIKLHALLDVVSVGQDGLAKVPSRVQKWLHRLQGDDLMLDALTYFGRADNWFDIYKTIECLIKRAGPSENKFLPSLG